MARTTLSPDRVVDLRGVRPRVSIGMPVYNGADTVGQALDSLLAQTFGDFELVICDNASEDGTSELCLGYARKDRRIRYYRSKANIGQIANFNCVLELSCGEYFRWAGCNDWWAPQYLERCVDALDAHPAAVLVTTFQEHYDAGGRCHYEEFSGERVDAPEPHQRYRRFLWFLQASRYYLDPIYSLIRRAELMKTNLLRPMIGTDEILAAELSLLGPWCHVPECLAFRRNPPAMTLLEVGKRYHPAMKSKRFWMLRQYSVMAWDVLMSDISISQKLRCLGNLGGHYARKRPRITYMLGRASLGRVYRAMQPRSGQRSPSHHQFGPILDQMDQMPRCKGRPVAGSLPE